MGVQLAGKVNDKTRDVLLSCRRKLSQKRKDTWFCSQTGDMEEKEKEAGSFPSLKKAPEGSWPNGNEPQGLLCFTGRSSACENLWNKAVLNYLSQCPDSTGSLPLYDSVLCVLVQSREAPTQVAVNPVSLSAFQAYLRAWPVWTQAQVAVCISQHHMVLEISAQQAMLYKELVVTLSIFFRVKTKMGKTNNP